MDDSFHFDMIRAGIALYGASPSGVEDTRIRPVVTLTAPVIQIRRAGPGDSVGYGAACTLVRPSVLATVAAGYGDGFPRAASGLAKACIDGRHVPVAGRVSMDLLSLDVTDLPVYPCPGDPVEFFGSGMPVLDLARTCGTIAYEIFTGLGERVHRRYI